MRQHRLPLRVRLASTYAAIAVASGGLILLIVTFVVGLVPSYGFTDAVSGGGVDGEITTDGFPPSLDLGISGQGPSWPGIVVTTRQELLDLLLLLSVCALLLLAIISAIVGWLVAGRMLTPLRDVVSAARLATSGDFTARIRHTGPRDEISDVAEVVNDMLVSLERTFHAHSRFAANASHELRTPLATMRAMLDVALTPGPSPLLEQLRETNNRSIDIVTRLLDLSDLETQELANSTVDLPTALACVIERCANEATLLGIDIDTAIAPATVDADPVLVEQLITNLLQNALRHNRPGGNVLATTGRFPNGRPFLRITNDGHPVSAESLERLTEPFARARKRTNSGGHGLGLSIVAAITTRINAALTLTAEPAGGLTATVTFRSQPAPPAPASAASPRT